MKKLIEKLKSDKKLFFAAAAGLFGVFLLILSSADLFTGIDGNKEDAVIQESGNEIVSAEDIEKTLEERLKKMVEGVKGAGNADVMITVDSAGEYIYAENSKKRNDTDSSSDENEIVIYKSKDGSDQGLIICLKSPEIRGVAVICDGGDSAVVKTEITKLITNLFGIGYDRVYVGSKK